MTKFKVYSLAESLEFESVLKWYNIVRKLLIITSINEGYMLTEYRSQVVEWLNLRTLKKQLEAEIPIKMT
jgi:hypothetical protein